jgi:dihydrofolate reductase
MIGMIVACSENNVIGRAGDLPWHLPDDLKHFMQSTKTCPVIMGRKTFASLKQPLPRRTNIVVSRSATDLGKDVVVVSSLKEALKHAKNLVEATDKPIWIAGGGEIYKAAMPEADLIVRTLIHSEVDGDVFFPFIDTAQWERARQEPHPEDDRHAFAYTIEWWHRRSPDS